MSSATSTKVDVGLKSAAAGGARRAVDAGAAASDGLQPWQFFVLAALGCATVAVFLAQGRGPVPVILISLIIGATALVGIAAVRTLRPLVSSGEDRTSMYGNRTRAALEREKMLALRSIKELEFDRAMGKLSESDWREMSGRLRSRAARLMRQLDAGAGYREQIERDLAARMKNAYPGAQTSRQEESRETLPVEHQCTACATINDADAKFCKGCGNRL